MKMIKTIALLIMTMLLLQVMVACQNGPNITQSDEASHEQTTQFKTDESLWEQTDESSTEQSTEQENVLMGNYAVFLYQNAAGAGDDVTPKYTGKDYFGEESYSKTNIAKKQTTISGKSIDLHYEESKKSSRYKDDRDIYFTFYESELLWIEYNANTGKIVRYIRNSQCTDREYVSDVCPQSDQEDFTNYVKKFLLDTAGVSVDGRKLKISTRIIKENGSSQYAARFVNNSDTVENFNAEYTFVFYSDIDGIARPDDVVITVTNVGELCSLNAMANDEAYLPFENVKIDRDRLNAEVEKAFINVNSRYNVQSYEISYCCWAIEEELWVEATVKFTFDAGETCLQSGVKYLIKVASLI